MPTVTRTTLASKRVSSVRTQRADSVVTSIQPTSSTYTWTNQVSKEVDRRDWKSLVRNGECATTPLSGTETVIQNEPAHFYIKYVRTPLSPSLPDVFEDERYGEIFSIAPFSGTSSLSVTGAKNQALTRFYSNLNAVETRFKGLIFTGELRESLNAIRHPARALRRGISDYLNQIRRFGRVRRISRQSMVRATWLEYSFGWSPLINDIDSAITAFYTSDLVRPIFEMVRGRGMLESESPFLSASTSPVTNVTVSWTIVQRMRTIVSLYGVYRHRGEGTNNLHHYGFRPSEFVPTLWELIPYSFVVDYFTNIGKILESWSYRFIDPPWVSQTVVTELERAYTNFRPVVSPIDGHRIVETKLSPGSALTKNKTVTRTPSIPLSIPSLELKVPGDWHQWINLAALSTSLERSRRELWFRDLRGPETD